jgi:hypothetical protein
MARRAEACCIDSIVCNVFPCNHACDVKQGVQSAIHKTCFLLLGFIAPQTYCYWHCCFVYFYKEHVT